MITVIILATIGPWSYNDGDRSNWSFRDGGFTSRKLPVELTLQVNEIPEHIHESPVRASSQSSHIGQAPVPTPIYQYQAPATAPVYQAPYQYQMPYQYQAYGNYQVGTGLFRRFRSRCGPGGCQ